MDPVSPRRKLIEEKSCARVRRSAMGQPFLFFVRQPATRRERSMIKGKLQAEFVPQGLTSYSGLELLRRYLRQLEPRRGC